MAYEVTPADRIEQQLTRLRMERDDYKANVIQREYAIQQLTQLKDLLASDEERALAAATKERAAEVAKLQQLTQVTKQ